MGLILALFALFYGLFMFLFRNIQYLLRVFTQVFTNEYPKFDLPQIPHIQDYNISENGGFGLKFRGPKVYSTRDGRVPIHFSSKMYGEKPQTSALLPAP